MTTAAQHAADILFNVATILESAEASHYQVRGYRRAARLLLREAPATADELKACGLDPIVEGKLIELLPSFADSEAVSQ